MMVAHLWSEQTDGLTIKIRPQPQALCEGLGAVMEVGFKAGLCECAWSSVVPLRQVTVMLFGGT